MIEFDLDIPSLSSNGIHFNDLFGKPFRSVTELKSRSMTD